MDGRTDQSANRAKLQQGRDHEDQRHLQLEFGKDDKKADQNEATECKSGRYPGHDMLQEPARNRAFLILCAIEDHLEQHGRSAPQVVPCHTAPFPDE